MGGHREQHGMKRWYNWHALSLREAKSDEQDEEYQAAKETSYYNKTVNKPHNNYQK